METVLQKHKRFNGCLTLSVNEYSLVLIVWMWNLRRNGVF